MLYFQKHIKRSAYDWGEVILEMQEELSVYDTKPNRASLGFSHWKSAIIPKYFL